MQKSSWRQAGNRTEPRQAKLFWTWIFKIHMNSWPFELRNTLSFAYHLQIRTRTRCEISGKFIRPRFFHVYVPCFLLISLEFCEDRKKIFSPCCLQNKGFQVLNKLKFRAAMMRGRFWKKYFTQVYTSHDQNPVLDTKSCKINKLSVVFYTVFPYLHSKVNIT